MGVAPGGVTTCHTAAIVAVNLRCCGVGCCNGDVLSHTAGRARPDAAARTRGPHTCNVTATKGMSSKQQRHPADPKQGCKAGCWQPTHHCIQQAAAIVGSREPAMRALRGRLYMNLSIPSTADRPTPRPMDNTCVLQQPPATTRCTHQICSGPTCQKLGLVRSHSLHWHGPLPDQFPASLLQEVHSRLPVLPRAAPPCDLLDSTHQSPQSVPSVLPATG